MVKNLSVVVTAYNEEEKLAECLQSVKYLADEIVVVDCRSTDKTAQIASSFTDKVFEKDNHPEALDIQKNFGFEKATGDWILSLDADERVTPELATELQTILENPQFASYYLPRKNYIFGKWIEHTGWYPDYQLRLFKRGEGKYEKSHVHEEFQIKGEKGKLTHPLVHLNYETVSQFLKKMITYAENEAKEKLRLGYSFDPLDAIRFPFQEFLSRYFAREGYRDGLHGLVLSLLMATYHLVVFCYLWEEKKFIEKDAVSLYPGIERERRKIARDLTYWSYQTKISGAKGPMSKGSYVLLRKLRTLKK